MNRVLLLLLGFAAAPPGLAQPGVTASHDPRALAALAERFLLRETAGLTGEVSAVVAPPRATQPACPAPVAFLPQGARLVGKTTVGVRCAAPQRWTIYLVARVSQLADYVSVAGPLPAGHRLAAADLVVRRGDLGALTPDVVVDPAAALGMELVSGLAAGAPLRGRLLRPPLTARAGQSVSLVAAGAGYALRHEGVALANARVGEPLRAKSAGGRVVSGVVQADGSVLVQP